MSRKIAKTTLLTLAILVASFMLMATSIPSTGAQLAAQQPVSGPLPAGATPDITFDTTPYLSFRPNPIGMGQQLLVNFWITPPLASNNRLLPKAYTITITKPDKTKDVFTMDSEPATAAMWFEYVPDQIGTWSIRVDFLGTYFPPGRYYNGYIVTNTSGTVYGSAYYRPSTTGEQSLTVQQDFVWSWPPAPLPTDYWTRPASLDNREWWPILGNFPGTGYEGGGAKWDELYPDTNPADSPDRYNFHPWVLGPNSAHVVWKRQGAIAGLIGGPAGQYGTTGSPGSPSVVYSGRAYQTMTVPINGVPTSCAVCYDIRTGEQFYSIPTAQGGVTPSYLAYTSPSEDAQATSTWSVELLTLSGGRLLKINPWTGAVTTNVSISPLSSGTYYKNRYFLTLQDLGASAGENRYRLINWTTAGTSTNFASRIMSNITWPWRTLPGQYASAYGVCTADYNVGIASLVTRTTEPGSGIYWNVNVTAADLRTGQLLPWKVVLTDETTYSASCVASDHGKVVFLTENGYFMAYDLFSGQFLWKTEKMDYPYGQPSFGAYAIQSAYGMFFRQSYDGVYAFNWTNGKIVWKYVAPALASFESPYITDGQEHYAFNSGADVADGKMYVMNTEHTPSWPRTRGWSLHCINITTGEGIWRITGEQSVGAIADGYLTASNSWDGYMYVYGKGKSATTVTAPDIAVQKGSTVMIKGTVLDQSPAQTGTPCVSKESMTTQMEYLHMGQAIGGLWGNATMTGVPVMLSAIGSDGSYVDIGVTTTNGYYGTFGKEWTPPAEGTYEIIASFAGDESYGSSAASTKIVVGPAEVPIEIPEQVTPPDYTMTIVGVGIAIMAVVVIAVAVAVLILRKR